MVGSIELILGCMFSGKSTEILRRVKRFQIIDKMVCVISHKTDTRYSSEEVIVTHNGVTYPCIMLEHLNDIYKNDKYNLNYDVFVIEEGQFFDDLYDFVINLADNKNKTVIVASLNGDFERKPFGEIYKLISHAEKIVKLSALCTMCKDGTSANFSKRITTNTEQISVGAGDQYIAVCRKHYLQ
jgi:thymidine kinase